MTSQNTVDNKDNQEINSVELVASVDSTITNVSLYSGRAEITRLFEFTIKAGQNKVNIAGLPRTFLEDSLRVEGQGNASIHDVIVAKVTNLPAAQVIENQAVNTLKERRKVIQKALESAQKSRATLNSYLNTITANDFDIPRLEATLDGYTTLSRKADQQVLDLEKDLAEVEAQIQQEKYANQAAYTPTETWKASIDIHGQAEEEIRVSIKYAVYQADWTASYDIRVDSHAKEKALTILYKASIIQNTGESWNDAPLTLETVTPSFGITPPVLHPWRVGIYQQTGYMPTVSFPLGISHAGMMQQPPVIIQHHSRSSSRSSRFRRRLSRSRSRSPARIQLAQPVIVQVPMIPISNKGSVATTLQIPGSVNIPSDGGKHNVTVAQLTLDATVLWYAIPSVDRRVHMKAKIQNNSEYTFVPGVANVYVDGSFIATTHIPSASPQEVFDCALGLDTSIRITYPPREKKSAKSGFYSKSSSQSFTQRISILNTKSTTVELKVIDRVPVSENERIEVKVLSPGLTTPPLNTNAGMSLKNSSGVSSAVQIAQNIVAQWDGVDEPGVNSNAIGKDGKLNWIVNIPPQKTVSLALQFEVSYPENLAITGL